MIKIVSLLFALFSLSQASPINFTTYSVDGKNIFDTDIHSATYSHPHSITNGDGTDSLIITDVHQIENKTFYSTKEHGVILSSDGITKNISDGLPTKIVNGKKVYRIITHIGGNSSKIYATTKQDVFIKSIIDASIDSSKWKKLSGHWADLTGADMDDYGNIVVGTALRGGFFSKDNGKTFYKLPYPKSAHQPLGNFESLSFMKIFNNKIYKAYQFNGIVYSVDIDSLDITKTKKTKKKQTVKMLDGVKFSEFVIDKQSPIYFPPASMHDCEVLLQTLDTTKLIVHTPNKTSLITVTTSDTIIDSLSVPSQKLSLLTAVVDGKNITLNNYYNCAPLREDTDKNLMGADTLITHYIPTYKFKTDAQIKQQIAKYKNTKINAFVIDLKDDHGNIRYNSSVELAKKARAIRPFIKDMQKFTQLLHEANIKLIARIVVFKDEKMSKYNGDKFAIWDSKTNLPMRNEKEFWCDPYNVDFGDYVIEIVEELQSMGVDEIQFDYIRFPTDYLPKSIYYRYKKDGANKRDAIETFLARAKAKLHIPISADIYGGSGWYNKSTGVGQEMDMLKNFVDIICPMYYPSHYTENFFRHAPEVDRPFRIYSHGVIRAKELSGNHLKVRPYVQAFRLGYSKYDRKYANVGQKYFPLQVEACDSTNSDGYGYWNAAGSTKFINEVIKK